MNTIYIYIYIYIIYIYILYICIYIYLYIYYIYIIYIKHGVLPHELWGLIWFSKKFFERGWIFLILRWEETIWAFGGDLEGYAALKVEFYTCSFIFSFLQDCIVV